MVAPSSFSNKVGAFLGISDVAVLVLVAGVDAMLGSGLICSANTNKRFQSVPSGVQVINVMIGFELSVVSDPTSVGATTFVLVIL